MKECGIDEVTPSRLVYKSNMKRRAEADSWYLSVNEEWKEVKAALTELDAGIGINSRQVATGQTTAEGYKDDGRNLKRAMSKVKLLVPPRPNGTKCFECLRRKVNQMDVCQHQSPV